MNIISKIKWVSILALSFILISQSSAWGGDGKVEFEWMGHGSFKFVSVEGKVILLDPWISTNPKTPKKYKNFKNLDKVDLILLTHGHVDHFMLPDIEKLINKFNPEVIAIWELQFLLKSKIPKTKSLVFQVSNKTGIMDWNGIKIRMTDANHSAGAQLVNMTGVNVYAGEPVGFMIEFENG